MKKYQVTFEVYATTSIEVRAESEAQAREKACKRICPVSVCHDCSDELNVGEVGEITEVTEA